MSQNFLIESGMSCQSCATRLEKSLLKSKEIPEASVNFATKTLTVVSELSTAEIESLANSFGFQIKPKNSFNPYDEKERILQKKSFHNLIIAFALSVPVVFLAMIPIHFAASEYIQFILTTLILIFPAKKFFIHAFLAAKNASMNMDTLVSLSSFSAWIYSTYLIIKQDKTHSLYFETSAMLIFLILIGKFLEEKAKYKSSKTLRDLALLKPEKAYLITKKDNKDRITSISLNLVKIHDLLIVKAGDKIPADGIVIEGESEINNSFMTGESLPVHVKVQSLVVGGGINMSSAFKMKVTQIGEQSELEKLIKLIEKAQSSKIQLQKLADKVSQYFIPFVFIISILTFLSWMYLTHNFELALMISISVLAVACPCALGLATPIAILVATSKAAREGILIRDAIGLEQLGKISVLIFDKTGTLTEGRMNVLQIVFVKKDLNETKILSMLFTVMQQSNHPISQSIYQYLKNKTTFLNLNEAAQITECREIPGRGMEWEKEEDTYFIGQFREENLKENEKKWFQNMSQSIDLVSSNVGIFKNGEFIGVVFLADKIRVSSFNAIYFLKKNKIRPILATGDNLNAAKFVSQKLGIDEFYAHQTPEDKYNLIAKFKKQNKKIAMVGDGINDAAALTFADVGIAMGSGTQIAGQSAHIILQKNDPNKITNAILLARKTRSVLIQNLFFAFSYNIVLIPLSCLGKLNPMVSAACMGASSLIVVLNSLRIR